MKNNKCGEVLDELVRLKKQIIRMHERENDELLEYIKSLEETIHNAREEKPRRIRCDYDSDGDRSSMRVNFEKDKQQCREEKRRKHLLSKIQSLEQELRHKERGRRRLESENNNLHKKATIDIVMDGDKPGKGAENIMKMARRVQVQLEDDRADMDRLEREVERLVEYSECRPEISMNFEDEDEPQLSAHRRWEPSASVRIESRSPSVCSSFVPSRCGGMGRSSSRGRSPCTYSGAGSREASRSMRSRRARSQSPGGSIVSVEVESPCDSRNRKRWKTEVKVQQAQSTSSEERELEMALESIQCNLNYLLEVDRRKKWQEAQIRHLGYYPQEKLPRSALWDPPNLI